MCICLARFNRGHELSRAREGFTIDRMRDELKFLLIFGIAVDKWEYISLKRFLF